MMTYQPRVLEVPLLVPCLIKVERGRRINRGREGGERERETEKDRERETERE